MGSRGACSRILRGCKGSRGMSRGLQSKKVQEVRGGQGGVQGVKRGEVGLLRGSHGVNVFDGCSDDLKAYKHKGSEVP